jgi:hypothetical protein
MVDIASKGGNYLLNVSYGELSIYVMHGLLIGWNNTSILWPFKD